MDGFFHAREWDVPPGDVGCRGDPLCLRSPVSGNYSPLEGQSRLKNERLFRLKKKEFFRARSEELRTIFFSFTVNPPSLVGLTPHRISLAKGSASATFPPLSVGNDPQGGSVFEARIKGGVFLSFTRLADGLPLLGVGRPQRVVATRPSRGQSRPRRERLWF